MIHLTQQLPAWLVQGQTFLLLIRRPVLFPIWPQQQTRRRRRSQKACALSSGLHSCTARSAGEIKEREKTAPCHNLCVSFYLSPVTHTMRSGHCPQVIAASISARPAAAAASAVGLFIPLASNSFRRPVSDDGFTRS